MCLEAFPNGVRCTVRELFQLLTLGCATLAEADLDIGQQPAESRRETQWIRSTGTRANKQIELCGGFSGRRRTQSVIGRTASYGNSGEKRIEAEAEFRAMTADPVPRVRKGVETIGDKSHLQQTATTAVCALFADSRYAERCEMQGPTQDGSRIPTRQDRDHSTEDRFPTPRAGIGRARAKRGIHGPMDGSAESGPGRRN